MERRLRIGRTVNDNQSVRDLTKLYNFRSRHKIDDLDDIFEVAVGTPPFAIQTFRLHTQMFKDQIGWLPVEQPDDNTIIFIKEDPELFSSYLGYVYLHHLDTTIRSSGEWNGASAEAQQVADVAFTKLIRLYLLAKRIYDIQAVNAFADEIVRFSGIIGLVPMESPITLAYASTKRGDSLRKLLCDLWISNPDDSHQEKLRRAQFPCDFIKDLAIGLFEAISFNIRKRAWTWTVNGNCADDA